PAQLLDLVRAGREQHRGAGGLHRAAQDHVGHRLSALGRLLPGRAADAPRAARAAVPRGEAPGARRWRPRLLRNALKETAMPFVENGDVRIRYETVGSGFPLLVTPGGGLNSRVSNWPTAVFNAMEVLKDDFRSITKDQRNANGGESTRPIPTNDPWGSFAD